VGIIDYIRQYTMDKQAETYYKIAIDRVAMKSSTDSPTVIAPPEYKKRFREAMSRNFLASPPKFTVAREALQPALTRMADLGVQNIGSILVPDSTRQESEVFDMQ
jgi:hypothetical protein